MSCLPPTTLLIDADDTLWENNIYFEQNVGGALRAAIFHRREELGGRRWDSASHIQAEDSGRSLWSPGEGDFSLGIGQWSFSIG